MKLFFIVFHLLIPPQSCQGLAASENDLCSATAWAEIFKQSVWAGIFRQYDQKFADLLSSGEIFRQFVADFQTVLCISEIVYNLSVKEFSNSLVFLTIC